MANSKRRCGKITSIGLGIFHMMLPLEMCLPNYVLLSPILKISWLPQSSSEVKTKEGLARGACPLEYGR